MLHFGGRGGGGTDSRDEVARRLTDNPALMQLVPLATLKSEAAASAALIPTAGDQTGKALRLLRQAILLHEVARRSGEVEMLAKAASAARRAFDLARGDKRLQARARVKHIEILVLSGTLFADAEALRLAEESVLDKMAYAHGAPQGRSVALKALVAARRALQSADRSLEASAASALTEAAVALERLSQRGWIDAAEARESLCDLAEMQLSSGQRSKDRAALEAGLQTVLRAADGLDPDERPLTAARIEILHAQLLAALGDLTGQPELITEGLAILRRLVDEVSPAHSPLDAARVNHALGQVLQTVAELFEDETLYDGAVAAMGSALSVLDASTHLPLRAVVAHDAAQCLARRAERRRDVRALHRAETAFVESLRSGDGAKDPLAWAVTQVALARIYEAEADICGGPGRLSEARFALASALEVFAEKGLRSLSAAAMASIERLNKRVGGAASAA